MASPNWSPHKSESDQLYPCKGRTFSTAPLPPSSSWFIKKRQKMPTTHTVNSINTVIYVVIRSQPKRLASALCTHKSFAISGLLTQVGNRFPPTPPQMVLDPHANMHLPLYILAGLPFWPEPPDSSQGVSAAAAPQVLPTSLEVPF